MSQTSAVQGHLDLFGWKVIGDAIERHSQPQHLWRCKEPDQNRLVAPDGPRLAAGAMLKGQLLFVTPANTSVRALVSFSENLNKRSMMIRISNANCSGANYHRTL
jgi:hypothetical protein